ncbi:MAG: hypothetical protein PWP23_1804 [Candidatus Sumerlaeota bacterium]|nr:hypothetical protein [Candidatus Sumerlaeota bacterium]
MTDDSIPRGKAPGSPQQDQRGGTGAFLGKTPAFWRAAAGAGLAAMGMALLDVSPLAINQPGGIPAAFIALALFVAGPPRQFEERTLARVGLLALFAVLLAWPLAGAAGFVPEREAAVLSLPLWGCAAALVVLGWRFRQQDPDLLMLTFVGAGVLRTVLRWGEPEFMGGELAWWGAAIAWCLGVTLIYRRLKDHLGEERALLGGLAWFVLLLGALTVAEMRAAPPPILKADQRAALVMLKAKPLSGWGSGGVERAFAEYALRPPAEAPLAANGAFRLVGEMGMPFCALLVLLALGTFGRTITAQPWDRARFVLLGAAGLWIAGVLAMRATPLPALVLLLFLWPGVLGCPRPPDAEMENPDLVPGHAWMGWAGGLIPALAMAVLFPAAQWHYSRQAAGYDIDAASFLPGWTVPLKDRAWAIRDRSPEIAQYADPRRKLQPVVEQWVAAAPHDEYARIEEVRWAAKTLTPQQAEAVALNAHERLPWSPEIALWLVRLKLRQGKRAEALAFLEQLAIERAPLHITVQARYAQLRAEVGNKSKRR